MKNLKATGIIRRVDDLGRIAIPKEMRRSMDIQEGDPMEIYASADGGIFLKKYTVTRCALCGRKDGKLHEVGEVYICHDCAVKIAKAVPANE